MSAPAPREIAYVTVDVFTTQRFGGNPLAVITDARGLDTAAMQKIAREFNYSETTFVLPPRDGAHTAEVRIFTPRAELPFAGHPNVGTGYVLACMRSVFGRATGEVLRLEEKAGLVPVRIRRTSGLIGGAELTAPERLSRGATLAVHATAACLGVAPDAIVTSSHQPQVASVGLAFLCVELADRSALAQAAPRAELFARALPPIGTDAIMLYVRDMERGPGALRARMFAPLDGVIEDPATGSAGAALCALLADLEPAAAGEWRFDIIQGEEMGRPSRLDATVQKRNGVVAETRIGGSCVPVMRGTLTLDG
ncbi:MAG: PhzF family phenazine biosynthesis protein [Rhodospirillales bacterium]|nr:PhzF family phenazine biosynthesis protein [Rhodospirillales bacterium]